MLAGLGWRRRRIPSQGTRGACRRRLPASEQGDGFFSEQRWPIAEHSRGKGHEIRRISKRSGVSGDSTHYAGILVMNLALNQTMTEFPIVARWRNLAAKALGGTKACRFHTQGRKNLAGTKNIQPLSCCPLQNLAQQDESNVAVLGMGAGIGNKRNLVCQLHQLFRGPSALEQTLVGG